MNHISTLTTAKTQYDFSHYKLPVKSLAPRSHPTVSPSFSRLLTFNFLNAGGKDVNEHWSLPWNYGGNKTKRDIFFNTFYISHSLHNRLIATQSHTSRSHT